MANRDMKKTYVKSYLDKHRVLPKRNAVPSDTQSASRASTDPIKRKETKTSYMRRKSVLTKLQIGSCNINHLPNEILLQIFRFLGPNDLLACARVCRGWLNLAKDNMLWKDIYRLYAKKSALHPKTKSFAPSHWKSLCIKQCKESRDKEIMPMLKKVSTFSGLCANTEKALRKSGAKWMLCFEDNNGVDNMIVCNDIYYFNMSVCIRWYALVTPNLYSIKKLKVYSANPIFFDKKGKAVSNSPCHRSLLFEMDFKWGDLKSVQQPQGSDDMVDIYIIPNGLLIATFKNGKDLAFITASFHSHYLVKRCLLGSSSKQYFAPRHKPMLDDIDSKYGLHDYTCTIELRNQRTSFWSEQFRNIYMREGDIGAGHARFVLIDPDNDYDRCSVGKKISFLWKTDVFKGCVEKLCFLDLTVLDERSTPMWCASSAVSLTQSHDSGTSYAFDGDKCQIEYSDMQGKLVMKMIWDIEDKQYYMVSLELYVSLNHINQWFGTRY